MIWRNPAGMLACRINLEERIWEHHCCVQTPEGSLGQVGMGSSDMKMPQAGFGLDFKKNWFIEKVEKCWEELPRHVVEEWMWILGWFGEQVEVALGDLGGFFQPQ